MDTKIRHLNIPFDNDTMLALSQKAVGGRKLAKVGRALFVAWLNDDPQALRLVDKWYDKGQAAIPKREKAS